MRAISVFEEHIQLCQKILTDHLLIEKITEASELLIRSLTEGGKVFFCGNGGSAADAQHLAAELSGRFYYDRPPLNAEALHCNTSYLTAVGNDYGYEYIFSRLLRGAAKKGDVLVALSTSGNSENIIKAFETAKELSVAIISLTGETGGKMKSFSDILFNVPSVDTPRIQELHIIIGHLICELVEKRIFPKNQ